MINQVWILFSLYNQSDDKKPINWATAVFENEQAALNMKNKIEETRTDIREVFIQHHYVCPSEVAPATQQIAEPELKIPNNGFNSDPSCLQTCLPLGCTPATCGYYVQMDDECGCSRAN